MFALPAIFAAVPGAPPLRVLWRGVHPQPGAGARRDSGCVHLHGLREIRGNAPTVTRASR
jgi:hypothetical protein